MRPYILAETNWKALKDAEMELAVLPWGATEAHNYHMPYGTDNIEADHIAAESARIAWERGAKVIVLPTIPFGVNTGQSDIYLDINMNPSTQYAVLKDVITVLDRQGIRKLVVFNSHGGNNFKPMLRELGLEFPRMFLCATNWFQAGDKEALFTHPGDHADEMETSMILYLRPDLVRPKEEWGDGRERKMKIGAFREGWAWAERKWSQATVDTGVGNPAESTAEKGQAFFKTVTMKAADLFFDLCQADPENMYED